MNSIQTKLRNRMVFLCNSICHMLGEDISRWTVFIDDNKDFPSLCGYDIIYYGHDDFIPDFQLTLRKATEKDKFIIICQFGYNGAKQEFVCSTKYIASEYVSLHETVKAAVQCKA